MGDAVHTSRMMIIRIVLYKVSFDVYVTNAGDIMINIVLNRTDVEYMHRQLRHRQWFPNPSPSLSLSTPCVAGTCLQMVASGGGGWTHETTGSDKSCVLPFICSTRTTTALELLKLTPPVLVSFT